MPEHKEGDDMGLEVPSGWRKDERRGWHFDKTLSIPTLLAIIPLVTTLVVWGSKVESRMAIYEERSANFERQRAEDRAATETKIVDVQQQLRAMDIRISDKLDRISEKVGALPKQQSPSQFIGAR